MRPLSAANHRLKALARLTRRPAERHQRGVLVVEGATLLGAALDAGATVREVYAHVDVADASATANVLDRLGSDVDRWSVPAGALDRVGDVTASQGLIAVVERPQAPWPEPDRASFVLVLDEVSDPGNVGTLIRAAAGAGAGAVVVAGGADPTAPKVLRASAGAAFGIDVVRCDGGGVAVAQLVDRGYRLLASVIAGGERHHRARFEHPLAVVVGNEARGVSAEVLAAADGLVTVEMVGPIESLNVAMAGTILCFEVLRRRQEAR